MSGPVHVASPAATREATAGTRPTLRFFTCGSVDDGKSTLIGRLLHEQNLIVEDHPAALTRGSIDVAYRHFSTKQRAFIVADAPGHEQYSRNVATGASNSELAALLVDARKGLLEQTRRHAIIASLLGIRYVVLAVNKIDLIDFDRAVFEQISDSFRTFAAELRFKEIVCIPVSALSGDNVSSRSARTPWYAGPHLLEYLETVDVEDNRAAKPFRMPVQRVNPPNSDVRGFAGTIVGGSANAGDEIAVLPSGQTTRIKQIIGPQGALERAEAGDTVTVTLTDEIDVAVGDMLAASRERPQVADQFAAHLIWMSADRLLPERSYLMKINNATLAATVTALKHQIDVNTFAQLAAKTLALNEIGVCNLSVARPVAFDPYADNRDTGAFILIDRYTNQTVAAGMIDFALRRATNIHSQAITVSKAGRSGLMHHKPVVLWFTGLSAAGKSTIANLVEAGLHARGAHTLLLDGDNIRHGLNRDLGFTEGDRVENIRRIGEVAKLMTDAGLIVLCSFISPFRAERRMVRELLAGGRVHRDFRRYPARRMHRARPQGPLQARARRRDQEFHRRRSALRGAGKRRDPPGSRPQGRRAPRARRDRGFGEKEDRLAAAIALGLDRIAAIDRNCGAGDEIRGGRRQKHRNAGKILRRAPALRRRARQHSFIQAGHLLARRARQIGVDPARQDAIDLDVVFRPGHRHRPRHLHDAAFAGGVRRGIGRGEDRHHRSDIDDLAAAGLEHVRVGRLRAHEGAGEVGVHHQVPFRGRQVLRLLAHRGAGVIDQDVEAPELPGGAVDGLPARGFLQHIKLGEVRLAAERAQVRQRRLRLGLVAPGDDDGGARRGQPLGDAETDAAVSAGDEGNAPFKVEARHRPTYSRL